MKWGEFLGLLLLWFGGSHLVTIYYGEVGDAVMTMGLGAAVLAWELHQRKTGVTGGD
jgi:hypothetical protein